MELTLDLHELSAQLLLRRLKPDELPPITVGIYGLFVVDPGALPMLELRGDGLLYVGMTVDEAGGRNHFEHSNSGFSSPRRSLGALLKEQLCLSPIPRGPGPSSRNWANYRFSDEDEARLTRWMLDNLRTNPVALAVDKEKIERIESQLIKSLRPPLNVKGVPESPNQILLKRLRRICREEARVASR